MPPGMMIGPDGQPMPMPAGAQGGPEAPPQAQ
jgi:hypothetical protein